MLSWPPAAFSVEKGLLQAMAAFARLILTYSFILSTGLKGFLLIKDTFLILISLNCSGSSTTQVSLYLLLRPFFRKYRYSAYVLQVMSGLLSSTISSFMGSRADAALGISHLNFTNFLFKA